MISLGLSIDADEPVAAVDEAKTEDMPALEEAGGSMEEVD